MQPTIDVEAVFRVKMGGFLNTDQITKILGFPCNPWITQKNFPIECGSSWEDEVEIINVPGRLRDEAEGLKILKDAGLDRPTHEHGIQFARQFGGKMSAEKSCILFLHTPWKDPRDNDRIICMDRGRRRFLSLSHVGLGFNDRCVLAGVRHHGK